MTKLSMHTNGVGRLSQIILQIIHLTKQIIKQTEMKEKFQPLFESYTFNNGVTARNRLAIAPLTHWSADKDGQATDEELSYLKARAHGFGLFISAATAVSREGIGFTGQPAAYRESDENSLRKRAKAMKSEGALAIAQLQHAGAAAVTALNGGVAFAPSLLDDQEIDTLGNKLKVKTEALTEEGIRKVIHDFAYAAELAIRAGFDGIELHGANGYLLQQFFSAKTNKRTDDWGGTLEKRMRLPLAVTDAVMEVRKRMNRPDFIIGYRLTPEEPGENGLTMDETLALIDALADKDVQYVHMSLHGFYNKARRGAGAGQPRLQLAKERLKGRGVALIGVGGLRTPVMALEAYNSHLADFVAIGLGVLVNPNFVELIETGKENMARKLPNIFRNAAYHQLPEPMWNQMMTFVPKWALRFATVVGKLLGWKTVRR